MTICRICSKEFNQDLPFCSVECAKESRYGKNSYDWYASNDCVYLIVKDKRILIDDDTYFKIRTMKWNITQKGDNFAITSTTGGGKKTLARFIMDCPADKYVLYKNGWKLDNRKCNLIVSDYKTMKGMGE